LKYTYIIVQLSRLGHKPIMEKEGCKYLTITPISKDVKNKGCIDYKEQEKRTSKNVHKWCWDDSKYNKAKTGEYFAFLFFERRVIIHKIENIKPPSERLDSWMPNVTQRNRQVLELSKPLKELSWREWLELGGLLCKQVTYTTNTMLKMPPLYQMLMEIEKEIETPEQKDVPQMFNS
jgi:hypothetical protein